MLTARRCHRHTAGRLAEQAKRVLMAQMMLVEGSGIVNLAVLPAAPGRAATGSLSVPVDTRLIEARAADFDTRIAVVVLAAAVLFGGAATIHIHRVRSRFRSRSRSRFRSRFRSRSPGRHRAGGERSPLLLNRRSPRPGEGPDRPAWSRDSAGRRGGFR